MNPETICNLIANKDTKAILDIIEGLEARLATAECGAKAYGAALQSMQNTLEARMDST